MSLTEECAKCTLDHIGIKSTLVDGISGMPAPGPPGWDIGVAPARFGFYSTPLSPPILLCDLSLLIRTGSYNAAPPGVNVRPLFGHDNPRCSSNFDACFTP